LWIASGWQCEDAWTFLRRLAAAGQGVDMEYVATRLARRLEPDDRHHRDVGGRQGPILSTIHASKGREAALVVFVMNHDETLDAAGNTDEEARVHYVAASRARHELDTRWYRPIRCGYHDGRAWRLTEKGIQIEVGREADVDRWWPLGADGREIVLVQEKLASFNGRRQQVTQVRNSQDRWRACLRAPDGALIGLLSDGCASRLDAIARESGAGSHVNWMPYLLWLDVTTVAVTDDEARDKDLRFPLNEARMWLAPVVVGMGFVSRQRGAG
jgi:hypothetical protein